MDQLKLNHQRIGEYCQNLGEILAESFFLEKETIEGKEILNFCPLKQVNFFIMKTLFAKWQEEEKRIQSPYFDFDHDKVKTALKNFMNVLSQHIRVNKTEFLPVLSHAIEESIYLAASPYGFLWAEISQMQTRGLSLQKLKAQSKYIKIHSGIYQTFLEELSELNKNSFNLDEVIHNLDGVFSRYEVAPQELDGFLDELSTFSPIGHELIFEDYSSVDINSDDREDLVTNFFEADFEEGFSENSTQIEPENQDTSEGIETQEHHQEEDVPLTELEPDDSINDVSAGFHNLKAVQELENPARAESMQEEEEVEADPSSPKQDIDELVIDEEDPEDPLDTINEKFNQPQKTLNDQLKPQESTKTVADKLETPPQGELYKSLTVNQRFMFLNELFKGIQQDMLEAFDKVERSSNFDEAVDTLVRGYAKKHTWKMEGIEVKELLKIVFKKFRNPD